MEKSVSPEIERVFSQLLRIEQRRKRIIESVSAHFGKKIVHKILNEANLLKSPLDGSPKFSDILDEQEPKKFLEKFASRIEMQEAKTIHCLRQHTSVYQSHVDEQIIFGARTAGQDASREFLSESKIEFTKKVGLNLTEAVETVFELSYNGFPSDKNFFITTRPLGGASVHFVQSPHIESWKSALIDSKFMYQIKLEWIRGILDLLSPGTLLTSVSSIECGDDFGLSHFHQRGLHAEP